ncbi:MAG: ABC transporter substrate-binding protein [Acidimicrobiia bacterium]
MGALYTRRRVMFAAALLALAACGQAEQTADTTAASDTTAAVTTAATETTAVAATTAATDVPPTYSSWDDVLTAAAGTTVNWFMWGGDDTINQNVDSDIGGAVLEQFDVTLNRVPLTDTADAVNQVLNESAAGVTSGGSIELIWINGENFKTMRDADLLYGPWAEELPNAIYVPWDDPAVANDFGTPVEGYESPWGHAQFVFEYNTELVPEPPVTFEALQAWIHDNPGLFTYPAIPDFTGSVFLRHVLYWAAGGPDPFLGEFDQAVFDQHAPAVWEYLNDLEPDLWRGGDTYPEAAAMTDLLANQEIAFNMGYAPGEASLRISDGVYPETIRTFLMDTGTLSNNNYVAIPFNAANPAGAMVVANYIISPEFQLVMADPERWGWEIPTDPATWPEEAQAALESYQRGVATLPAAELASKALPEPNGEWVTALEEGWVANVLEQ